MNTASSSSSVRRNLRVRCAKQIMASLSEIGGELSCALSGVMWPCENICMHAVEVAEPLGVLVPAGAHKELAEIRVVIDQGHVIVAQAGLVGVGPQKLVGRPEGAAQHEVIVHQPALQHLAFGGVDVERHHGQFDRAG